MNGALHKRSNATNATKHNRNNYQKSRGQRQRRRLRRKVKKYGIGKYCRFEFMVLLVGFVIFLCLGMFVYGKLRAYEERIALALKYNHSDSLPDIGDKSLQYAQLREIYDAKLPENDTKRMKDFVQSLRKNEYFPIMKDEMTYDVFNCPPDPPPNYPFAWNVKEVLDNWPIDDTTRRNFIYQGICVFDFETEDDKIMTYMDVEVPFVIRNDPKVLRTSERWNQPEYMEKLLGAVKHRTEFSHTNHFMYFVKPPKSAGKLKGWKEPTQRSRTSFHEWFEHAKDESKLSPDKDHWYYRLIGCGRWACTERDSSEYLFDELAFFQPREDNLYLVHPKKQQGIHCRFGMKGVISENHFDGTRNMIAVMGGERRYLLAHPDQCEDLALYPKSHPSSRHSAVDWSNPDWKKYPQFKRAEVNEIVLQAGDVLYLPTYWFHHIISLNMNFQCNTRSGASQEYKDAIRDCGF